MRRPCRKHRKKNRENKKQRTPKLSSSSSSASSSFQSSEKTPKKQKSQRSGRRHGHRIQTKRGCFSYPLKTTCGQEFDLFANVKNECRPQHPCLSILGEQCLRSDRSFFVQILLTCWAAIFGSSKGFGSKSVRLAHRKLSRNLVASLLGKRPSWLRGLVFLTLLSLPGSRAKHEKNPHRCSHRPLWPANEPFLIPHLATSHQPLLSLRDPLASTTPLTQWIFWICTALRVIFTSALGTAGPLRAGLPSTARTAESALGL